VLVDPSLEEVDELPLGQRVELLYQVPVAVCDLVTATEQFGDGLDLLYALLVGGRAVEALVVETIHRQIKYVSLAVSFGELGEETPAA
jgi:hypothetical protein